MLNQSVLTKRKTINIIQSVLLIAGMALILSLSAELLFGNGVGLSVFLGVATALIVTPRISPQLILRLYQAEKLTPQNARQLHYIVNQLSHDAGLKAIPEIYWLPSNTLNAFAVGDPEEPAIAITNGLINRLNLREITGVLAHETSHIAHNDMRLMGLADLVSRLTHLMSLLGVVLALIAIPFMLLGIVSISLLAILLLFIAPTLSAFLQMALSRTREFSADMEAAQLTGDPEGLASALYKMEQPALNYWLKLFNQGYRNPNPSLLRSHPQTEERIERLLSLRASYPLPTGSNFGGQQGEFLPTKIGNKAPPKQRIFINIWR